MEIFEKQRLNYKLMKNFIKLSVAAFLMAAAMVSCTRLEVTLPEGPRGEQGIQGVSGVPGKTAYEIWKEYIASGEVEDPAAPGSKWDPGRNTVYDFFTFLVGPKGDDGLSSYEVWIEAVERHTIDYTGSVTIVDYFKYLEGKDGKDGLVPYIGDNGNWFIGDEDTGVPARGDKGEKGDGGLSAYEIWKMSVLSDEGLPNPGNGVYDVGEYPYWPADAVSEADFYLYLLAHEYKHYAEGGTGLRSLLDAYVWLKRKRDEMDWDYIAREAEKMGIADFERENRSLATRLFTGEALSESDENMLDYILSSGTYGTVANRAEGEIREKGHLGYFLSRLTIPRETMLHDYPILKKAPVLYPVMWLWRFVYRFFTRREKLLCELKAVFTRSK